MRALTLHFSLEFMGGLKNKSLLMMNYLMPLGFYALVGGMMTQINPLFLPQTIPAMALFAILTSTIMGLPNPLIEAREGEVLRSYKVNGVSAPSLLLMPAISTAIHVLVVCAIITITAPIFFGAPLPGNWPLFILVLLTMLFTASGLGCLIGVIAGNTRSALLWQQLLYIPSMLLSGLMMPGDLLPETFSRIGHILPTTYAMKAMMGLAFGGEAANPGLNLLVLFAGGIMAYALAGWLFQWDSKHTKKGKHPALAALAILPYLAGLLFMA